jgi:hypothetical protein
VYAYLTPILEISSRVDFSFPHEEPEITNFDVTLHKHVSWGPATIIMV